MNSSVLSYRPRLDGLRFVAITFVLIEHLGGYLAGHIQGGYYGVDLFFVISGYLITGILLKDTGHSFGQSYRAFVGRRALRIFPAYYLVLLIAVIVSFGPARELFPWLATYTFNYPAAQWNAAHRENSLFYLWSLSVEEQFYLLWPPLVIALRNRKQLLLAITALIVLFGYAQLLFHIVPSLDTYNYTGTLNRMGSLGLGALGAIYVSWRPITKPPFDSAIPEYLAIGLLTACLTLNFRYRYVLMGPCSLFLVLKAAHGSFRVRPLEWLLTHRRVIYIGSISYGIYLFHVPVTVFTSNYVFDHFWNAIPFDSFGRFEKLRWHSWILKFPVYSGLSIACAAASYRWFESPILAYKDKWFSYRPSRSSSDAPWSTKSTQPNEFVAEGLTEAAPKTQAPALE